MSCSRMRGLLVVFAMVMGPGSSPAWAQWRLGVEVGAARFWGGSLEAGNDNRSLVPYRPTTLGIGLERQTGRYAVGLQLHYAEAGLALSGPEVVVATRGAFTILSISPEAVLRIATVGMGNQLRVHAGPLLEFWDLIDLDSRTRLGVQASVSLDVPLGKRIGGAVVAGGAVIPSPYNDGELDVGGGAPTYELRTLWRRSFALRVQYEL